MSSVPSAPRKCAGASLAGATQYNMSVPFRAGASQVVHLAMCPWDQVEEGLCDGRVIYHSHVKRSAKEVSEQQVGGGWKNWV